jgi:sulfate permease, SulP family
VTKLFSAPQFARYTPQWLRCYRRELLGQDAVAGAIVALMLVPQSMAYALLAGLPPQYGMYASILPLFAYAWFGSSMTLAVGPVAITSLMTAAALTPLMTRGSAEYIAGAAVLALLSGAMLFILGLLRFGFLAKLLSNPVISGFTSGSSLLILIGQLSPLLGVPAQGATAIDMLLALLRNSAQLHVVTALVGIGALLMLALTRAYLADFMRRINCGARLADLLPKLMPMLVVIFAILLASNMQLAHDYGVAVVGVLPQGLPNLAVPVVARAHFNALLWPAFTIALINFVSSISVAQTLAIKRKQRIDADAELRALGAANIASALSGGMPVNGGFARSLVGLTPARKRRWRGLFPLY